jgi:hypothetical protein
MPYLKSPNVSWGFVVLDETLSLYPTSSSLCKTAE